MVTEMVTTADKRDLLLYPITEQLEEDDVSQFGFPVVVHIKRKLSKVVITIMETPTFDLLDRCSHTAEQGSDEGTLTEKDNQYYEYITTGKGRFRKMNSTEAQTMNLVKKTKITMASTTRKQNKSASVSGWDMYDTYNDTEERASG
jgi:hypothetical protein